MKRLNQPRPHSRRYQLSLQSYRGHNRGLGSCSATLGSSRMVQIRDLCFTKPFSESYLRNNRSSGQKSLRCFPHCAAKGHRVSGFCGDKLEATAIIIKNLKDTDNWLSRISVVGEIRPCSDQGISSGNKISKEKLLLELRDIRSTKIGGELVLGEIRIIHEDTETAFVAITFNAERHSWDYSWKSNRWSGVNSPHVVDVILMQSLSSVSQVQNVAIGTICPSDDLDIYCSACSAPFLILSSHKSSNLKRKQSVAPSIVSDDATGQFFAATSPRGASTRVSSEHQSKWKESFSSVELCEANNLTTTRITHSPYICMCHNQLPSVRINPAAIPSSSSAAFERSSLLLSKRMKFAEFVDSEHKNLGDVRLSKEFCYITELSTCKDNNQRILEESHEGSNNILIIPSDENQCSNLENFITDYGCTYYGNYDMELSADSDDSSDHFSSYDLAWVDTPAKDAHSYEQANMESLGRSICDQHPSECGSCDTYGISNSGKLSNISASSKQGTW